jgi:hypothetical protein
MLNAVTALVRMGGSMRCSRFRKEGPKYEHEFSVFVFCQKTKPPARGVALGDDYDRLIF